MTHGQVKAYRDELEDEINKERILMGKRPFSWDTESELNLRKISHSDPEGGYYVKGEREKQFAYSAYTSCDDSGFILATLVTPENVHDSQAAINLVKQSKRAFPNIKLVIVDAGYKNPKFVHFLTHLKLYPVLPYSAPHGVKGMFRKKDFVYDDYFDCYLCCPNNQPLLFSTITRDGYRTYKLNPKFCMSCPLLETCTLSATHQKVVTRHVWYDLMDELEHQRYTAVNREIYKKRKQTIERVVADAKEKHGMRWANYRGLEKGHHAHDAYVCRHEFKETSHMVTESRKGYGFLFQIYTKDSKKELV